MKFVEISDTITENFPQTSVFFTEGAGARLIVNFILNNIILRGGVLIVTIVENKIPVNIT